jgi:hypothetical protein
MAKNGRLPKETAVYDSVMLPPFQQRPTLRCQLMRDKKQTNFGRLQAGAAINVQSARAFR